MSHHAAGGSRHNATALAAVSTVPGTAPYAPCVHARPKPDSQRWTKRDNTRYEIAAITPAAGSVRTHAHTMRPAIPHRTADRRFVAPTPTIEPVIVCVVLTGIP